jgi:DNA invertase Pin-like site-specific DNA recombinase
MARLTSAQKRRLREQRDPNAAVVYCRVSSKKQAESGFGLSAQKRECLEYCAEEGLDVLEYFEEPGVSATEREKRQEYLKMLRYCYETTTVSKIVVRSQDRFSANIFHAFQTLYDLRDVGVDVIDISYPINTSTAAGRYAQNCLIVDAFFERERGKERTKSAMAEARIKGYWVGYAPMGYINVRTANGHGSLGIDPEKDPLVKNAFKKVCAGGYTLEEVREHVNSLGLTTRFRSQVSAKTFRRMLSNPVYKGVQYVEGYEEPFIGTWKPLVSKTVFDSVQTSFRGRVRRTEKLRRDDSWRYPLRRFLKCIYCGNLTASSAKSGQYLYYHCSPKKKCGKVRIPPSLLHMLFAFFLNGLVFRLGRITLILLAVQELQEEKESVYREQLKVVKRTIARLDKEREETEKTLIHNPSITDEICLRDLERINDNRLEAELQQINLEVRINHSECIISAARRFIRNLSEVWMLGDLQQRQRLQKALFPVPHTLGFDVGTGFQVPSDNLMIDGERSHTFECIDPALDLRDFAEFLHGENYPSDSWELENAPGQLQDSE